MLLCLHTIGERYYRPIPLSSTTLLLKVEVDIIGQLLPYIYNTQQDNMTLPTWKRAGDFGQATHHMFHSHVEMLNCSHVIFHPTCVLFIMSCCWIVLMCICFVSVNGLLELYASHQLHFFESILRPSEEKCRLLKWLTGLSWTDVDTLRFTKATLP